MAALDGIINLNKPAGLSSAQALARVRKLLGQPKAGHAGTLDPLADGVLVVCLGRATRLVESLMEQPKIYRTVAALDLTSDSFDCERPLRPVTVSQPPNLRRVQQVLAEFEGLIMQVPPAFSALKIGGRPAYKLTRAGRQPDLAPRPARIHWIQLRHYDWPVIVFELACGRGTYVRALIRDIGLRLGTGGCLTGLTRLAVGPFDFQASWSLERLAGLSDPAAAVVPVERARQLLSGPARIPPRPG